MRETEKVRLKTLDGSEVECEIYTRISLREKYDILLKAAGKTSISSKDKGEEIMGELELIKMIPLLAERIWADTNKYRWDEVDGNDLHEVVRRRAGNFLGDFGIRSTEPDNQDGEVLSAVQEHKDN